MWEVIGFFVAMVLGIILGYYLNSHIFQATASYGPEMTEWSAWNIIKDRRRFLACIQYSRILEFAIFLIIIGAFLLLSRLFLMNFGPWVRPSVDLVLLLGVIRTVVSVITRLLLNYQAMLTKHNYLKYGF